MYYFLVAVVVFFFFFFFVVQILVPCIVVTFRVDIHTPPSSTDFEPTRCDSTTVTTAPSQIELKS